jgi:hypothetical protein
MLFFLLFQFGHASALALQRANRLKTNGVILWGLKMNFRKVGPMLLLSGVMAGASLVVSSAAMAQQAAPDCQIGIGVGCEETFGSSSRGATRSQAAPAQTPVQDPALAAYDAYRTEVKAQQEAIVTVATSVRTQVLTSIARTCQAVSPNQPTAACP